ncbi:ribbon-helix-helix domain-containing protein [Bradyrhizobium sp. CCGB01]|uniref:ribbon-helix-helix domain-containing protein n=1 Tax=Bradyrhizobium sp. CCGB01 TaxID=2949634 RepID=UPI0035C696BB
MWLTCLQFRQLRTPARASSRREELLGYGTTTATLSISLSREMAGQLEHVRRLGHRTCSELVREALRRYFDTY